MKDEVIFNIIDFQKNLHAFNSAFGKHHLLDILYFRYTLDESAQEELIAPETLRALNKKDKELQKITDYCQYLSLDELEEIRSDLAAYDIENNLHHAYSSRSTEIIFLNSAQDAFDYDSEEIDWVIQSKLVRAAQLIKTPSPLNDGKMGLFAESASVIDTITGRKTDGTNPFYLKTQEKMPIITLSSMVDFSDYIIEVISRDRIISVNYTEENKNRPFIYSHLDAGKDNNTHDRLINNHYDLVNSIAINPEFDPFATISEQRSALRLIEKIIQSTKNPTFKKVQEEFCSASDTLIKNIETKKSLPLSYMRIIPN